MADDERPGGNEDEGHQEPTSSPTAALTPVPEAGGSVLPNPESQVVPANHSTLQSSPSEVVVAGGNFTNTVLGPHTSTNYYEAKHIENATIKEVHHHYYDNPGSQEPSTSDAPPPKKRRVGETSELEEGFIRICRDVIMYDKEPMRKGTNIYKGYQEHVTADGTPTRLRPVAIKKLVPSSNKHKTEVQHLVTLASHTNVVGIIRSKEHKTTHASVLYIIMELCSLQNLQDYLEENRENGTPFNFKKTMQFTKQLLDGMKHIHDNGIVHRDVKPDNVLLSTDKTQLKFTDFGLGKELHHGRSSTRVTNRGQGTDGYRAPETYFSEKVSKSSDIFSLGITIFALWSDGGHPFGANALLRDNNIVTNTNHDFSGLLITGTLKEEFLDLIDGMLQHDPNLRPTIHEVLLHPFFKQAPSGTRAGQQIPTPPVFDKRGEAPDEETVPKEAGSSSASQPSVEEGEVAFAGRTYFASEEEASRLRREHKYDEAITVLLGLQPNERQQSILAECYFQVGKDTEALECMERLKAIISSSPDRPKPDDAIKKVETYIDNSLFIQALILLPSVAEICKRDSAPKDALWGFVLCIWRGASIVEALYKQGGRMEVISKTVTIQLLHQIYGDLQEFTGADDNVKTDMASRCLNDIGISYLHTKDYEKAIDFYRKGIDTMKNHFGSTAVRYSVFRRLHNNLGVLHGRLGNYHEAETCLVEALKVSRLAEDYLSEEQRKKATDQSLLVLRRIRQQMQEAQDV